LGIGVCWGKKGPGFCVEGKKSERPKFSAIERGKGSGVETGREGDGDLRSGRILEAMENMEKNLLLDMEKDSSEGGKLKEKA
jgi:hypothetical protein